jgi:hypothetical protein
MRCSAYIRMSRIYFYLKSQESSLAWLVLLSLTTRSSSSLTYLLGQTTWKDVIVYPVADTFVGVMVHNCTAKSTNDSDFSIPRLCWHRCYETRENEEG